MPRVQACALMGTRGESLCLMHPVGLFRLLVLSPYGDEHSHVVSLDARFGNHFADRLPVDLLDPLIGKFRVAFAGPNGRMPQEFLDRDHLGASLQEVGGKGMAQTVTAGLDAG